MIDVEKTLRVPETRFKGFDKGWVMRNIESLIVRGGSGGTPLSTNKDYYNGLIPFLGIMDITSSNGRIYKTEKHISEKGLNSSAAWIVPKGSVSLAMYASVGKVAILERNIATSQAFYNMVFNNSNLRDFVYYRLKKMELNNEWNKLISTGTQSNLNAQKVKEFQICVPHNIKEQQKIGEFFKNIDSLLTNSQKKYNKLQNIKKALLEKMFPKDGENVPEIRFNGFTDTWQQQRLFELGESFEYGLNASAKEFDGKNKYLRITDIDESSRQFLEKELTSPETNLDLADNFKLEYGDILFARTGASVGKSYIYQKKDGNVYYAGYLIRVRVKQTYYPEFVFYNTLTENYKKYIYITSQRSGQPGVNAKEYANYTLKVPGINEQKKIGDFFLKLDNTIRLHKEKHERLLNIKKALLEKMFV